MNRLNQNWMEGRSTASLQPTRAHQPWKAAAQRSWAAQHPGINGPGPRFETNAPDDGWRLRFQGNSKRGVPYYMNEVVSQSFRDLVDHAQSRLENGLLAYGGWAVCHETLDEELGRMLTDGFLVTGAGSRKVKGIPSSCHTNAAETWARDTSGTIAMLTGYGLSEDGMWRPHSWLARCEAGKAVQLIETTVLRIAYFGFIMRPREIRARYDEREHPSALKTRMSRTRVSLRKALAATEIKGA